MYWAKRILIKIIMLLQIILVVVLAIISSNIYNHMSKSIDEAAFTRSETIIMNSPNSPWYIQNKYAISFITYISKYYTSANIKNNTIILTKKDGKSSLIHYTKTKNMREIKETLHYIQIPNIQEIFLFSKMIFYLFITEILIGIIDRIVFRFKQ